jgi:hypothetical protein
MPPKSLNLRGVSALTWELNVSPSRLTANFTPPSKCGTGKGVFKLRGLACNPTAAGELKEFSSVSLDASAAT